MPPTRQAMLRRRCNGQIGRPGMPTRHAGRTSAVP
jgi:hypothetical protein